MTRYATDYLSNMSPSVGGLKTKGAITGKVHIIYATLRRDSIECIDGSIAKSTRTTLPEATVNKIIWGFMDCTFAFCSLVISFCANIASHQWHASGLRFFAKFDERSLALIGWQLPTGRANRCIIMITISSCRTCIILRYCGSVIIIVSNTIMFWISAFFTVYEISIGMVRISIIYFIKVP